MANTVPINPATSGSPVSIYAEDLSGSVSMPTTKLHNGATGTDGGAVTATNPLPVALSAPAAGGGATSFYYPSAPPAVQQAVKASAGTLKSAYIIAAATAAFFQIWDALTGSVTPGTTAPVIQVYCPANTTTPVPIPPEGIKFATGITMMQTTTLTGATGSAAGVAIGCSYI